VLSALDDRITLLRETNTTLETIAQALFKSWFVDFDPVHAKMQGRVPEGMDQATAALFPDSFEESELGPVPKGWRIGSVEDLCSTITNGGTPSRSKPVFWEGGSIPWFKTGEFHDGFLLKASEFITGDALNGSSVKLLPKDAVLMAIYAAPTVGRLGILTEPATFNQACTGMVAKADIGPWFLFWTLFNGRDWFNSRANGAAQQNISKAIVAAYRLVVPANSLLAAFNNSASSLHDSIRLNSEKAQTLSALRDTLLPRLISGQLRIPKTRTEMESV
jgi:type I restriction enzyme S subunit